LFEALGWNFEEDVWPETDVSGKRVIMVKKRKPKKLIEKLIREFISYMA